MADKVNVQYQNLQGWNTEWFTLLATELQSTATRTSEMQLNVGCQGVLLEVVLANEAANCSFQPVVYTKDNDGNEIAIATFTAVTANGTTTFWVHPHADKPTASKATITEVATMALPKVWYMKLVYSGTPATDKMDTTVYATYVI